MIEVLNELDIAAACVGNHDLDVSTLQSPELQTCQHAGTACCNQKMPAPEIFCTLQARGRGVHRGSRCAPQTRAPHSACGRLDCSPPPPPAPPCCPLPPAVPSREAPSPEGCRPAARADARTRA